MESLAQTLTKWVVNDYFTPNIKAEVILDTLLTNYVDKIIKEQCGEKVGRELRFITKEMSVFDQTRVNNTGSKIDYILSDEASIYLVELKTADGSIKTKQAKHYLKHCIAHFDENIRPEQAEGKSFGEVFGRKLLSIMAGRRGQFPSIQLEDGGEYDETTLNRVFFSIFDKYKAHYDYDATISHAGNAMRLIKRKAWAVSGGTNIHARKYIYTMGQLLDDIQAHGKLWEKKLKLIYITPYGNYPHKSYQNYDRFYIHPDERGSVSLYAAVSWLQSACGTDSCAQLLAGIIEAIYETEAAEPIFPTLL